MSLISNPMPGVALPPGIAPAESMYRLSVEQYHEMIRAGILTENDPVELLDGVLVEKMPKNPAHSRATRKTRVALAKVVPQGWIVDSQEPITLDTSEPEPDVFVTREDEYVDRHPGASDIALLGEVSESSLDFDRGRKLRTYASASIAVYWSINLQDRQVETYSLPSGPVEQPGYGQCQVYLSGDAVPLVIDGREVARIAVQDLLP